MTRPTSAQYQRARLLVAQRHALRCRAEQLDQHIAQLRAARDTASRTQEDRLNFRLYPDRLAGLAELAQRNAPEQRRWLFIRYRNFLESMIDALPGGRPLKVDFHALPLPARPYLLAPFLGLVVGGRFPQLCLERSNPGQGTLTYICTSGPADPAAWTPLLPKINSWLGHNWTISDHTASTVTLSARQPLPQVIPFTPSYLRHGQIFYGFDVATCAPVYIPLSALTHTLTVGQSGSGKSVFLNQVLLSLLFNIDLLDGLSLIDLKGGVELGRYAGVHPKIRVITDYADLPDLISTLVATMKHRLAKLRTSGQRAMSSDFHIMIIDEYAAIQFQSFSEKADKDRHKKLLADLNLLAAQARAPGIKLWAQLQKPTSDAMDTAFRTNLQSTVAFKIPNINAAIVFDGLDDMPAKPASLTKGRFILRLDGHPDRIVQSCLVPDDINLPAIVALGRSQTLRGRP